MHQRYLEKYSIQSAKLSPEIIQISRKYRRYAVEYSKQRIGIIRPGVDCWIACASIRYGAIECRALTRIEAINSLVNNFLRVEKSGLKFEVSCDQSHYIIKTDSWLIKIDVFYEYCRSSARQTGGKLEYRYFPDLNSAITCSFQLILETGSPQTHKQSLIEEF